MVSCLLYVGRQQQTTYAFAAECLSRRKKAYICERAACRETNVTKSPMMIMGIPDDPDYLAAVGALSLRHAQWDCILRMVVKSIKGIDIPTAYKETPRFGSAKLRKLVLEQTKKKLGDEHPAIAKLEALLDRGEALTEERNLVIHSIVAKPLDADEYLMRDEQLNWSRLPTAPELRALGDGVGLVTKELNEARFPGGFLHAALSEAL